MTSSSTGLEPGQGCALAGVLVAAFSMFVFPLVLGPAGMVLGAVAYFRGERRGKWVIVFAAVGMVLGILLGLLPAKFVQN